VIMCTIFHNLTNKLNATDGEYGSRELMSIKNITNPTTIKSQS